MLHKSIHTKETIIDFTIEDKQISSEKDIMISIVVVNNLALDENIVYHRVTQH